MDPHLALRAKRPRPTGVRGEPKITPERTLQRHLSRDQLEDRVIEFGKCCAGHYESLHFAEGFVNPAAH